MKKAVVFDFDYTMGNSEKGIALSINYALEMMGHDRADMGEIRRTIGLSLAETWRVLTEDSCYEHVNRFSELFKERADEVMVDNTELYPGTKDMLVKLKKAGCSTAIVTTKYHYRIRQILEKYDAVCLVDAIVGAEDVKFEKPSPEGLIWVMNHLGVPPKDVLYVGDSIVDAQTAMGAGVDFAAVLTGTTPVSDFERMPHVFIGKNVTEITGFVYTK